VLPLALGQLSLAQAVLGRHREAVINGTEAVRIAQDTGQPLWERYASGALAYLAAIEGNEERSRQHARRAELDADAPTGSSSGTAWAQCALALLDLGHGRWRSLVPTAGDPASIRRGARPDGWRRIEGDRGVGRSVQPNRTSAATTRRGMCAVVRVTGGFSSVGDPPGCSVPYAAGRAVA
jgi:hypothetical protein